VNEGRRRSVTYAAVAIAALVAGGGRAALSRPPEPHEPPPEPTVTYRWSGAAFEYPAAWFVVEPGVEYGPSTPGPFVSDGPLVEPCTMTATRQVCREPVRALAEGTFVAQWRRYSFATRPYVGAPVADAPADRHCASLGGTRSIEVHVTPGNAWDGWAALTACVRGPGEDATRERLEAVARSLR
jgi:hypothetical protein